VHRDLKPANVMLTEQGHVKVMDFGLAKRVLTETANEDAMTMAGITQAGARLGTPAYMSPEQILGDAVDARSDVFAFGIVLAEMIAGTHPFAKDTAAGTMAAIVRDAPRLPGALSGPMRALLDRLLAKEARDRPSFDEIVPRLQEPAAWDAGRAAPRERVRGERRVATLLVASASPLADTRIAEGDEESIEILRRAVDRMDELARRYEGTITERRDEGIVAVFGAPTAHEDAARRAVHAVLEMRSALQVLGAGIRAGVHTGPVVVEEVRAGRARITPLGDTSRVASRLEARAAVGELRLSGLTADAVAPYFVCREDEHDAERSCRVERATGARERFDVARDR